MWNAEQKQRELDAAAVQAELDRIERRQEREAFLTAIHAMMTMSVESAKASAAQANAFQTFLDSFRITEPPTSRVLTEEADYARFIAARQAADAAVEMEKLKGILDDPFAD